MENTDQKIEDAFATGEDENVKAEVIISSPDVETRTVFSRYADARTLKSPASSPLEEDDEALAKRDMDQRRRSAPANLMLSLSLCFVGFEFL